MLLYFSVCLGHLQCRQINMHLCIAYNLIFIHADNIDYDQTARLYKTVHFHAERRMQ